MPSPEIESLHQFLAPFPEEVQALAWEGREFLLSEFGPISEVFYDAINAVCVGISYTGGVRDVFVNFAVYADHVTLIFTHGAKLIDPERRLRGDGNQVRNIRLQGIGTLKDPYVLDLMHQAAALAPKPQEPIEPKILVKVMNGKKRRP